MLYFDLLPLLIQEWKDESRVVRAPEVARPKIDESRVKRKLPPEALDRGYTGQGDDDDDDDDGGKRYGRRGDTVRVR